MQDRTGDYKEFIEMTAEDAAEHVNLAKEFLSAIKDFVK